MAAEVVDAAIVGSPVCFASYGHPLVYCYPAILIQRAAKLLNLRVEMFPGISSLDTLLLDLRIDFAADGLQMYEATDLLLRRKPIQNDVPCILWQTNVVADPTYVTDRKSAGHFLRLQNYLLQFYSPEPDHSGILKNLSIAAIDRRTVSAGNAGGGVGAWSTRR
jgi:hypothetical protein